MFSPLLPSALDARTEAFPVLSVSQIDRIRSCSRSRQVAAGDILFEPGDENVPFYVLLSGGMEIVQPDLAGEHLIAKHGPAQFTGEMTMISGRRCLVRGRVTEPGEFLELTGDGLRSLVARDAELSDIFMRAFILRRLQLISQGQGNVILLGSRHSANTLRLREFLSRNGYPYRYVDLETDSTSQELLDRFAVTPSEIPVVICTGRSVLRNPSNQELADCLGFNTTIDESQVRDLIIVGAGPAGLAAAVYAGSEGLDVLMIETTAPGGQAGSSSKIENYLGFPTGISGQELATRAIVQAEKFGARMMVAHRVVRLECARRPFNLALPAYVLGVVTPSATTMGTLSGTVDVNKSAGSVAGAAVTGGYTIVSTTGRGTGTANFTGGTSIAVVFYANRNRRFSVLDVQSNNPYVLGARLQ